MSRTIHSKRKPFRGCDCWYCGGLDAERRRKPASKAVISADATLGEQLGEPIEPDDILAGCVCAARELGISCFGFCDCSCSFCDRGDMDVTIEIAGVA